MVSGFGWIVKADGAIAQLGERLLCKQEVVGSIPSGSTNFHCVLPRFALLEHAQPHALAKSRISRTGNAVTRHLLHREEGIDLRLPPAATTRVVVEEAASQVSSVEPPAVGSISMKIWS